MIRYSLVKWEFNKGAWAQAIANAVDEVGIEVVASTVGVAENTVRNWRLMYQSAYGEFPHPSMHNFLSFCNMFDLDARDFFILEE